MAKDIDQTAADGSSRTEPPTGPPRMPDVEVIATNFKRRLSGVTSTLERVVPAQSAGVRIAALGPGLGPDVDKIRFRDLLDAWRPPPTRPFRIWHARRNIEMLPGWLLRDVLRMPLRVVFTSAAQRRHTAWTRFLISRMDAVIATSAKSAAYVRRESTVVRHGIDVATYRPASDKALAKRELGLPPAFRGRRLVGCFGRVRHQKGTDVFIDAMLEALPSRPDVAALVLGRTTEQHVGFERDLKRRIAQAKLEDRVLFAGEVPPPMNAWYQVLDLFVAPSRWEGFGVTPLEAMACEVPVVATRAGAFEELLDDGVTGTLVPPGEVAPMREAIVRWLDDPTGAARAGAAGRTRVAEQFSLEREAAGINAVYEALWAAAASMPA
jgi:mannosyltransferase